MQINIPMTAQSFWQVSQVAKVKGKLLDIKQQYAAQIAQAAMLTGVPADLINSVIFLESAGKANAKSGAGAAGLMQVTPDTAGGVIFLTRKAGTLTADLRALLISMLGVRIANIEKQHYMNEAVKGNTAVTTAELFNPTLNILIGSMLLALLITQHTENGVVRLDKVITRYNKGYFYKPKGTVAELLASVTGETKTYILKLVGINSTMDILTA